MGAEATIGKVTATNSAVNANISFHPTDLPNCVGCSAVNGFGTGNVKASCASVEKGSNSTVITINGLVVNAGLLITLNKITGQFNCSVNPNTLTQKIAQVL
jgi:hypothetical protein